MDQAEELGDQETVLNVQILLRLDLRIPFEDVFLFLQR